MRRRAFGHLVAALAVALAATAAAEQPPAAPAAVPAQAAPAAAPQPGRGPETNLPLPRFVSLKANEGNARRGPGLTHRVDWVFTRAGMPLMVTAEFGHWRRVQDRDGVGGWVHYALLSGARTVVAVTQVTMRRAPRPDAPAAAILEAGVIARLGECRPDWCELRVDGYRGWAEKSGLWGVGADEIRD
jgi:SH3-like domain-containing protein